MCIYSAFQCVLRQVMSPGFCMRKADGAQSNEAKNLLTVFSLISSANTHLSLSLPVFTHHNAHTHTRTCTQTNTQTRWVSHLMGARMILLSRLWWSSLATLWPVHSTATEVARQRMMPRQQSTLNTDRYQEWLKPQSYNTHIQIQRGL